MQQATITTRRHEISLTSLALALFAVTTALAIVVALVAQSTNESSVASVDRPIERSVQQPIERSFGLSVGADAPKAYFHPEPRYAHPNVGLTE